MHLRISFTLVVCCAILHGFASAAQSNADKSYYTGEINIDANDDLEGSGGGTEFTGDLESSGSGYGTDDEDSKDVHQPEPPRPIDPIITHKDVVPEVFAPKEEDKSKTNYPDLTVIMNPKSEDRPTFFAQPGILAAVIGGAVVGLLCAILVVMFIVYRMRKKDEGSYPLDEPKRSPTTTSYNRGNSKEFFA